MYGQNSIDDITFEFFRSQKIRKEFPLLILTVAVLFYVCLLAIYGDVSNFYKWLRKRLFVMNIY